MTPPPAARDARCRMDSFPCGGFFKGRNVKYLAVVLLVFFLPASGHADSKWTLGVDGIGVTGGGPKHLAQVKADLLASQDRLFHPQMRWPAGARREGVGKGKSAKASVRACCYWGQRKPVYIGTSQSPRTGTWYACVIYR